MTSDYLTRMGLVGRIPFTPVNIELKDFTITILQRELVTLIKTFADNPERFLEDPIFEKLYHQNGDTEEHELEKAGSIPASIVQITGLPALQNVPDIVFGRKNPFDWQAKDRHENLATIDVLQQMIAVAKEEPKCSDPVYGSKFNQFIGILAGLNCNDADSLKKSIVALQEFDRISGGIGWEEFELKIPAPGQFSLESIAHHFQIYRKDQLMSFGQLLQWSCAYAHNVIFEAVLTTSVAIRTLTLDDLNKVLLIAGMKQNIFALKLLAKEELSMNLKSSILRERVYDKGKHFENPVLQMIFVDIEDKKLLRFLLDQLPFSSGQLAQGLQCAAGANNMPLFEDILDLKQIRPFMLSKESREFKASLADEFAKAYERAQSKEHFFLFFLGRHSKNSLVESLPKETVLEIYLKM